MKENEEKLDFSYQIKALWVSAYYLVLFIPQQNTNKRNFNPVWWSLTSQVKVIS